MVGYYQNSSGDCVLCPSTSSMFGCSSCLNSTVCTDCFQGFYLSYTTHLCVSCGLLTEGCSTCNNLNACIECNAGYYLSSGSCLACSTGCLTCTSASITTCYSCT